jgi:hypothetical protein
LAVEIGMRAALQQKALVTLASVPRLKFPSVPPYKTIDCEIGQRSALQKM